LYSKVYRTLLMGCAASFLSGMVPEIIDPPAELPQLHHLFFTLCIRPKDTKSEQYREYEGKNLPDEIQFYDIFFQKNYPEVVTRAYGDFFCDSREDSSVPCADESAALVEYLDAVRFKYNKKGVDVILQCVLLGDSAAKLFIAVLQSLNHTEFPHIINSASLYDISLSLCTHKDFSSLFIRQAYFFLPKNEQHSLFSLSFQEKRGLRTFVSYDPIPESVKYPFWVLGPVFIRHLSVLRESSGEILFSPDSVVLKIGKSRIDVSEGVFSVVKKFEKKTQKADLLSRFLDIFSQK
jgi:hypothetical protein